MDWLQNFIKKRTGLRKAQSKLLMQYKPYSINKIYSGNMNKNEIHTPNLKTKPWHLLLIKFMSIFKIGSSKSDRITDSKLERNLNQILDFMESLMETQND